MIRTASISIRSPGNRSRSGSDADEALGQIKGDVDYKAVAEQVYPRDRHGQADEGGGLTPPAATTKSFKVMGKEFDPAKPEEYIKQLRDQAAS